MAMVPGIIGTPRSFHKRFKFRVEFDGLGSAAFKTCSEIAIEFATVEHREGGVLIPDKSPGLATIDDLTLERGATMDRDLYDWLLQVGDIAANGGQIDAKYKRMGELVQYDRDNTVLRKWRLHNCWVKRFVAGAWDNEADENVIESVVLAYDYPELIQAT
jgi:phage tail-like protein